MKTYAICDASGAVRFASSVQDGLEPHCPEGMSAVEVSGPLPAGPLRLVDGLLVPLIVEPTLAELRAAKWAEVKAARNRAEFGGFTWDGSTFDSDPPSQSRIQGAAQLASLAQAAGQAFEIEWTLADNAVRTLSGEQVLQVGHALGAHITEVHSRGRQLRAHITAAGTADEVVAVAW